MSENEVRMWLRDTGSGISVADQACIFDRFARNAHLRYRGGGLGLATSRRLPMPTAGSSKSRVASDRDRHHDRPPATTSLLNVYVNPLRKQLSPHVIETATAIDCTIE